MLLENFSTLYTVFEGQLLFPTEINVSRGSMVKNDIAEHLTPAGLVFPYGNAVPIGDLTIEYLDSDQFTWLWGRLFLLLRNDGLFEEYFHEEKTHKLMRGKISPGFKRQVFSDENIVEKVSPILLASKDIDHYANVLERTLGYDTSLWKIYNIKDLHQYVLGNIKLDQLNSRNVKSEYKTIWLK